ncbi:conserved hypothetical protein [Gammaproteobacteria bacterium]
MEKQTKKIQEDRDKERLYLIREDVKCVKCNSKGAVKFFGTWKRKDGKIGYAVGFGGTVPYKCLNCGGIGLINCNGLEGYKMQFKIIEK